ncbi:MAG: hypothetical protein ACE5GE_09590 [Phycisphaerae bacterium]
MRHSTLKRALFLVLTGGIMIQFTGCGTLLAPIALGLAENFLLSFIFGGALGV